jgi:hypothetical protein
MEPEVPNYKKPAWIASAIGTLAGLVLTSGVVVDGSVAAQIVGALVTLASIFAGNKVGKK